MNRLPDLTIGEVARRAGVATSVLRYYERIGLLPPPERVGGQRRYDDDVLASSDSSASRRMRGSSCGRSRSSSTAVTARETGTSMRSLSTQKLDEVEALLERTRVMKGWLEKAKDCGCSTPEECALFPAAGESHPASDLALRVVELDGASRRRPDEVLPVPTVPRRLSPG